MKKIDAVKTEIQGWVKKNDSLVNTDENSLESYKRQKLFHRRIDTLENEVKELKRIIKELVDGKA